MLELGLTGTFSLSTDVFYFGAGSGYADIKYAATSLSDAQTFESTMGGTAMREYFQISGKNYDDLKADNYQLWKFNVSALKGLRFSCSDFDLENGDVVVFKKGFPLTYTTTSGKDRTVYLDKDYVYRYNGESAFVYQENMTAEDVVTDRLEDTAMLDDINSDETVDIRDIMRSTKISWMHIRD